MPLLLEPVDVVNQIGEARSVLIASCPICPAFSLAMRAATPLFSFDQGGPRLIALKDHEASLRETLNAQGVRTETRTLYTPVPMMCLWTKGQRNRFARRARAFDMVLVLGCESATHTVKQALKGTRCRVVQAMQLVGITNATVGYETPMKFALEHTTRVPVNVKPHTTDAIEIMKAAKEPSHG